MLLHFHDPSKLKTRKVLFEEAYHAHDSDTLEQLKELSSRRKALEESINGSTFISEAIAREMSGGITSRHQQDLQKLENYLPLLENLIEHADMNGSDPRMLQWMVDLNLQWNSALSASSFFSLIGPKFFRIDNLRYELGMILFLYGALMRERAFEVLPDDLVQAATLFRKAAGVYNYLTHTILPVLQPFLPPERPPEVTTSMSSIMCLICLAEAQAVTTRKAEEKASRGSLLAKLHYGVTQLLIEAMTIIDSNIGDLSNISSQLIEFISLSSIMHESRSRRYMATELSRNGQVGLAIGILRHAVNEMNRRSPSEQSWRVVFEQEINALAEILQKLEQENDFVWLDKIPCLDELPFLEGKKIASIIPYAPVRLEKELVFRI
ncbi:uncharacterized protein LOC116264570 isoform X1 [Nymphaea colorata]|nr:uncharacterized protein LOC116264570 isoform X1 [Nymphaea colorata]